MRFRTAEAVVNRARAGRSLAGSRLEGFSVEGREFAGLDLSDVEFVEVDLSGADLTGARLVGAEFESCQLDDAVLCGVAMSRAVFDEHCTLRAADVRSAKLDGANLARVDLRGVSAARVDLSGAVLEGARLSGAALYRADLFMANLVKADLQFAQMHSANLRNAQLPSPSMMLLAGWMECSAELTALLMRLDAGAHPDPEAFELWARGGPCPYSGVRVQRAANFSESRRWWVSGPTPTIWEAWSAVRAEHCPDWPEEPQAQSGGS